MTKTEWTETLVNSSVAVTNWTSSTNDAVFTAPDHMPPPGSGNTFILSYPAFNGLILLKSIDGMFRGNIGGFHSLAADAKPDSLLPLLYTSGKVWANGTQSYEDAGVGVVMANLARSMTTDMRQHADAPDNQVLGTAWTVQVYMAVRWRWIALPVALHTLTLCLLTTTIALTAKKQLPLWKGSVFPLLRARVGGGLNEGLVHATKLYEMERAVEKVRMELESGVGRATFVPQRRGEHGEVVMLHAV